jgi:hypothetical protein
LARTANATEPTRRDQNEIRVDDVKVMLTLRNDPENDSAYASKVRIEEQKGVRLELPMGSGFFSWLIDEIDLLHYS